MKKILLGLSAAIVNRGRRLFSASTPICSIRSRVRSKPPSSKCARPAPKQATARSRSTSGAAPSRSPIFPPESASEPQLTVKIASVTASGVSQTDPTRFSADSINVADIEVDATMRRQPLSVSPTRHRKSRSKATPDRLSSSGCRLRRPSWSFSSSISSSWRTSQRHRLPPRM